MPTDATHASPPEITDARGGDSAATLPDSMSPSRGPLATTRLNTLDIRPRRRAGVSVCEIVLRHTALTLSAAPAIARSTMAITIEVVTPASAIAIPQTATDAS